MNNYIMSTNMLLVRNEAYMQLLTVDISEEGIANDSGTLLTILLKDRTTNKNIVWASPSYEGMGKHLLHLGLLISKYPLYWKK